MWAGHTQRRTDTCDVVVVGAGLVGAAVAARLARARLDTAILEAQTAAGGTIGRSTGMVLTGLPGHYNWAVVAYGRGKAQEAWALTAEGRKRLVETASALGVPVERTGSLALAAEDTEVDALRESEELLREDGFDARFSLRDPLNRGFRAVLSHPDDVTADAAALTQAMLAASGATLHERTLVQHLEPEQGGVRVWAQGRTVLCESIVLAINAYAPLFDTYFADKVAPVHSLTFTTAPLDSTLVERPCHADYGYTCCRQLPDRRLLLGRWHRPNPHPQPFPLEVEKEKPQVGPADVVQDQLTRFAARHFPEVDPRAVSRSSGTMGFAPDGLPLVGRLPHLPQACFALGLGSRGLAWALVVAERLVELMLHDAAPGLISAARLG